MKNWKKVFRIPYECTASTKLQTLHYRIVHRYLPTKRYLYVRGVVESQLCPECDEVDTLEHCLYQCIDVRDIWSSMFSLIHTTSQEPVELVLFGIEDGRQAANVILLLVKQYIVGCKLSRSASRPSMGAVKGYLNNYIMMEKRNAVINLRESKFNDKWQGFIDDNACIRLK